MINIAFGLHDVDGLYSQNIAVVISSIVNNHHMDDEITVYILHDSTLRDHNKKLFKSLMDYYRINIKLIYVDDNNYLKFASASVPKTNSGLTIGMFYRLLLPNILSAVDRIIYLDCDILCLLDIQDLWSFDLGEKCIAAAKDSASFTEMAKNMDVYKNLQLINSSYFNSGVLLMNLKKIRKEMDLFAESMEFLKRNPLVYCPDQDALNFLFQDKCVHLPRRYNYMAVDAYLQDDRLVNDETQWSEKIWHFAGPFKPWSSKRYLLFELYWLYLAMTPWYDEKKDFVKRMYLLEPGYLENIMLTSKVGSRKKFIINFLKRLKKEIFR